MVTVVPRDVDEPDQTFAAPPSGGPAERGCADAIPPSGTGLATTDESERYEFLVGDLGAPASTVVGPVAS